VLVLVALQENILNQIKPAHPVTLTALNVQAQVVTVLHVPTHQEVPLPNVHVPMDTMMMKILGNVLNVNTTVPVYNLSSVKLVYMTIVNLETLPIVSVWMDTMKILMEIVKSVIVNVKHVRDPVIIAKDVKEENIERLLLLNVVAPINTIH
jgi:hypothetical protein